MFWIIYIPLLKVVDKEKKNFGNFFFKILISIDTIYCPVYNQKDLKGMYIRPFQIYIIVQDHFYHHLKRKMMAKFFLQNFDFLCPDKGVEVVRELNFQNCRRTVILVLKCSYWKSKIGTYQWYCDHIAIVCSEKWFLYPKISQEVCILL